MNFLDIYDNFLSEEQRQNAEVWSSQAFFRYGYNYNADTPTKGLKGEIEHDSLLGQLFLPKFDEFFDNLGEILGFEVSILAPSENPYFTYGPKGGIGKQIIYFPQPTWDREQGGEIQFYYEEELEIVAPKPNRLIVFDASVPYKDCAMRDEYKRTIEVKFDDSSRTVHQSPQVDPLMI